MKTPLIFLVMVVGMINLGGSLLAGERLNQDEARELVEQGKIQPLADLLERHQLQKNARLLDIELERDEGRLIYELDMIGSDGVVREYYLDASSGQLIKLEVED